MKRYVLAIDQSTSASKAFLIDRQGVIFREHSIPHKQSYPMPGFVEHDAAEIWANVWNALAVVSDGIPADEIACLSISNQRETTVFWDRETGEAVRPAVVWQDTRAQGLCDELKDKAAFVREKTGLLLSPYYPAAKAAWVLRDGLPTDGLCIGTIDSYLIYRMKSGKTFACDVTNASRMQLMDLDARRWDETLCGLFGVPMDCLPEIRPSDSYFGEYHGIPIIGVMGDSHAAFFGQGCAKPGDMKATYGTGSSVMLHTGHAPALSDKGLSASVGYCFQDKTCYVQEGNITCSGDTLNWLCEVGLLGNAGEAESIAATVQDTQGVYLVPAFNGLGAPRFDGNARAVLCGMNRNATQAHIIRAGIESIAFQVADVVNAMAVKPNIIRADGKPSGNALLMQFQADILGCDVIAAPSSALSALGAAYMGGIIAGMWDDVDSIPSRKRTGAVYHPQMNPAKRDALLAGWTNAVMKA
jgi:glycerol kinase